MYTYTYIHIHTYTYMYTPGRVSAVVRVAVEDAELLSRRVGVAPREEESRLLLDLWELEAEGGEERASALRLCEPGAHH